MLGVGHICYLLIHCLLLPSLSVGVGLVCCCRYIVWCCPRECWGLVWSVVVDTLFVVALISVRGLFWSIVVDTLFVVALMSVGGEVGAVKLV